MTKKEKLKAKIGILSASMVSLSYIGFSPIIALIAQSFPEVDISLVQMILTIPNLMYIVFSPLSGFLMLRYKKKNLMLISIALYIVGGLLPFFLHSSIWMLLLGSILIGSGSGLMMPTMNGLICDCFELEERGSIMGLNATFVAAGALCFIFGSGFLSGFGWHYSYLVFLILIPILVMEFLILPEGKVPEKTTDGKAAGGMEWSPIVLLIFLLGFVYFITQNAFNTNSSLAVAEYGIENANAASLLTLGNTIGGLVGGILFGLILKKLGDSTISLAVLIAAIGFILAGVLHFLLPVSIGGVMVGFGFAEASAGGTFLLSKYTKAENNAFTLAMYNGFVNFGAAISPYFINHCAKVFGTDIAARFLFSGAVLTLCGIVYYAGMKTINKDSGKES
ncbi:MAG: MFS transporter [Blautia sp.]|nr:MFS transporter [Blautia sp.]